MQLKGQFNKEIPFLSWATNIYGNSWVISLKDKNSITITNAFQ